MRISDWSADVCSTDLPRHGAPAVAGAHDRHQDLEHVADRAETAIGDRPRLGHVRGDDLLGAVARITQRSGEERLPSGIDMPQLVGRQDARGEKADQAHGDDREALRSEEPTSEFQSLMRISYAAFGLKETKRKSTHHTSS